jgi:GNAT superfamily N-acetyltransferase
MTAPAATIVRRATPKDRSIILSLIDALATYEKLAPPSTAAKARLLRDMSGDRPRFEVYLAEYENHPAGYTFIFEAYSSFLALPTLYLEDFFVLPEYRSKGIGKTLFNAMVNEAHHRGCGRMEWTVLDWNKLAIDFYDRLGAKHMDNWHLYRLVGEDLARISAESPAPIFRSSQAQGG